MPYKDEEKAKQYWKIYHSKPEQIQKRREYQKRKYYENIEESRRRRREDQRKYRKRLRMNVLIHYGGNPPKCACCGEDIIEFLTIDHIYGGGDAHRKRVGGNRSPSSLVMYRWIIKNNYPVMFQVLCYNCNCAKGCYGYCPHQRNNDKK